MAMQTGLEGRPWWHGLLIGAVVALVVLAVAWWWQLSPMYDRIEQQETRLADLQQRIQEGRAMKQKLPQFREQVRALELELDKLLRILPARRNTPDLLRRIRALAEQGDFGFKSFRPKGFVDREFYSEWPIDINLTGDYHNLAMFFDRISRLSRIINVENLNISASTQRTGSREETIAASFTAKTFVYKEPETDGTAPEQP
jgi:type IV pilus assembly protein PilO